MQRISNKKSEERIKRHQKHQLHVAIFSHLDTKDNVLLCCCDCKWLGWVNKTTWTNWND